MNRDIKLKELAYLAFVLHNMERHDHNLCCSFSFDAARGWISKGECDLTNPVICNNNSIYSPNLNHYSLLAKCRNISGIKMELDFKFDETEIVIKSFVISEIKYFQSADISKLTNEDVDNFLDTIINNFISFIEAKKQKPLNTLSYCKRELYGSYRNVFDSTYVLVHGTTEEKVDKILKEGLNVYYQYDIDKTAKYLSSISDLITYKWKNYPSATVILGVPYELLTQENGDDIRQRLNNIIVEDEENKKVIRSYYIKGYALSDRVFHLNENWIGYNPALMQTEIERLAFLAPRSK